MSKVYVALFMGQGGWLFSWGMYGIADMLRTLPGVETKVYRYIDWAPASKDLAAKRAEGCKIAGVGFSLGCSALSYLQRVVNFDLVFCMAASKAASNYAIVHQHTKRSVLWHGKDYLSSAVFFVSEGETYSFDMVHQTNLPHLLVPLSPTIRADAVREVKLLT